MTTSNLIKCLSFPAENTSPRFDFAVMTVSVYRKSVFDRPISRRKVISRLKKPLRRATMISDEHSSSIWWCHIRWCVRRWTCRARVYSNVNWFWRRHTLIKVLRHLRKCRYGWAAMSNRIYAIYVGVYAVPSSWFGTRYAMFIVLSR